jgi:hypothetical protein
VLNIGVLNIGVKRHGATTKKGGDSTPTIDLRQHPTGGGTPIEISLGLYVTNVVAIAESRESLEVSGYLTENWKDRVWPNVRGERSVGGGEPKQGPKLRQFRVGGSLDAQNGSGAIEFNLARPGRRKTHILSSGIEASPEGPIIAIAQ